MSMSQIIDPYHMSIVLSRVDTENVNYKPGLEISSYVMVEEKDSSTAIYRAISSQQFDIRWLAED